MVCGDGHRRRCGHRCALGCLRGQAAAQGDALWVRRGACCPCGLKGGTAAESDPEQQSFCLLCCIYTFCGLTALLAVLCSVLSHREAFEPMMESGELVVRYRARRTYSRRTTEATCELFSAPACLPRKLMLWLSLQQEEILSGACPNLPGF